MKKIELLQSVALFWDLSEAELGYISEKMIARHYESGKFIFLEDSEGEQCFFVIKGSVKVTRLSKDGREVILAMLNEGEFFGELALLDGESRSANVIALEETEVLTLNREDFLVVLQDYVASTIHGKVRVPGTVQQWLIGNIGQLVSDHAAIAETLNINVFSIEPSVLDQLIEQHDVIENPGAERQTLRVLHFSGAVTVVHHDGETRG